MNVNRESAGSKTGKTGVGRNHIDPGNRQKVTADNSYQEILGTEAWKRLKPEVRQRFSVKPGRGRSIAYKGKMKTVELSLTGWLFAQACRLIGTPLAPWRGTNVPMSIDLAPDNKLHGVLWKRQYQFSPSRSFTVHSTKCKGGNGEFIEHIGHGFSMRLKLSESEGKLVFKSIAYEIAIRNRTVRIPSLLTPGTTTVTHEQLTGDRFRFTLSVDHPFLGRTIYQDGEFYSAVSDR